MFIKIIIKNEGKKILLILVIVIFQSLIQTFYLVSNDLAMWRNWYLWQY